MAVKNKNALAHYQSVLNGVRRDHPNKPFHWQQKEASRLMHSSKPAAVGKAKKKTGGKVSGKKKTSVIIVEPDKRVVTHKRTGTNATLTMAKKIQATIDKMESERKQHSSRQIKDIYAHAINAEHAKLRKIEKQQRARR